MDYEICLLCSSFNWPWKVDAPKNKVGWGEGPQKGTKSSTFWGLKGFDAWGYTSKHPNFVNSLS